MAETLRTFAVVGREDLDRLGAFIARHAPGPPGLLASHTARPRYRPQLTILAEADDAVAGCALASHTRLRLGAATLDAGRLDAVLVAPDHPRPHAVAEALSGAYLAALYDQGIPFATADGRLDDLGALGFAPYRLVSRVRLGMGAGRGGRDEAGEGRSPLTVRPAAPADLDDLAALYEATYAALPLSELRAAPDWRHWLGAGEALVLEDGRGRVAAYARLDGAHAVEAAAADAGVARELLAALGERRAGAVELRLPPAHPVARTALHLGGALTLEAPDPAGPLALAGVVDLPGALESLAPELARRLAASRYAGWEGGLRIELAAGRATLLFGPRQVTIVDGTRPADVRLRRVTLPALAQLLLGYRPAADLRATGELDCDDQALGLVDAVFPA